MATPDAAAQRQPFTGFTYKLTAPRTLVREENQFDLSSVPSDSLVAQTLYSVLSPGTEVAAWVGKPPLRPSTVYPRVLGYCNVARVRAIGAQIGAQITDLKIGDIILTQQCHRSAFCVQQKDVMLSINGNSSPELQRRLAVSYLYHLGYMALLDGGFRPGYEVAIVGFGALGFTAASLVSAYGGRPHIISGRAIDDTSRDSIPHASFYGKDIKDGKLICPDMGGVDLVINTSDAWSDYSLSLNLVRRGGTVALVGFPGRGLPAPEFNPLNSQYLYDKAITIKQIGHVFDLEVPPIDARFTLKRNIAHLYSLLKDGRLNPSPLINTQRSSDELAESLNFLEHRPTTAKSVLLAWPC
jgi:NADPH:quinone reductase-like Zn-dependent oxidoreductase